VSLREEVLPVAKREKFVDFANKSDTRIGEIPDDNIG
jgi:hypothetical protein